MIIALHETLYADYDKNFRKREEVKQKKANM